MFSINVPNCVKGETINSLTDHTLVKSGVRSHRTLRELFASRLHTETVKRGQLSTTVLRFEQLLKQKDDFSENCHVRKIIWYNYLGLSS